MRSLVPRGMHESPTTVAVWDVKASRIDPEKSQIARRDDDRSFDRVRYEIRGKRNPDVAPRWADTQERYT